MSSAIKFIQGVPKSRPCSLNVQCRDPIMQGIRRHGIRRAFRIYPLKNRPVIWQK